MDILPVSIFGYRGNNSTMWAPLLMVFSGGLYDVFLKKSLGLSSLPQRLFLLIGQSAGFILLAALAAFVPIQWNILLKPEYAAAVFAIAVLWFLSELFRQRAYSLERVSVLMPWANLTPFLLILIGFLLFSDTSFHSFLVALTAVSVLVIVGFMDTEAGFTRGGGVPWFLGGVICNVSDMLLSAWMVKTVPVSTFVVITLSVYFAQIVVVSWHPAHWRKIMLQPAKFWYFRLGTSLLWYTYWFLEVFLYSELGIVLTTTLCFAQLSITLGASRLILADHPRKRDIALSTFLVLAAALSYALR